MSVLEKSKALLQLIRPELPVSAGICVVVGQTIALGEIPPIVDLVMGFGLGLFLSSPAMIFNDFFDLEVDRINTPYKPIPLGVRLMKSTTQGRTSGDAGVIYQCHYRFGGVYFELCPLISRG